jgi:hypothetical protein
MEYKYPIAKFSFEPTILNPPQWITLDVGKVFEIHAFDDEEAPGFIFFVLVLPEKTDRIDGGTFMQIFYSRFTEQTGGFNYSIPKEEFELEKLPGLVRFEIRPFGNPRKRKYVESCGIYMRIDGTSYYGCAPLESEDRIFAFDLNNYLENADDKSELSKIESVEKKLESLEQMDSKMATEKPWKRK